MLEHCLAPVVERYLHDFLQYAPGVLQIISVVPYNPKLIVNASLSNDNIGIKVILDAANGAGYVEPEIIQAALSVLVNIVCPSPSISIKPSTGPQGQLNAPVQTSNDGVLESRDKNSDRIVLDRGFNIPGQSEYQERIRDASADRGNSSLVGTSIPGTSTVASGLVGDRRISLGAGGGCIGLATQLEQGYRHAREAVRSNNGIKILIHLLQPHIVTPPGAADYIHALACRVLLGLARDDTTAHILKKLQIGKRLSDLIHDSGVRLHLVRLIGATGAWSGGD